MYEVGSVNGKLVVGVELGGQGVVAVPDVGAGAFKDEHSMVHCWAGKVWVGSAYVQIPTVRFGKMLSTHHSTYLVLDLDSRCPSSQCFSTSAPLDSINVRAYKIIYHLSSMLCTSGAQRE